MRACLCKPVFLLKPTTTTTTTTTSAAAPPLLHRHFSSTEYPPENDASDTQNHQDQEGPSSFSYFTEVKNSLKQKTSTMSNQTGPDRLNSSSLRTTGSLNPNPQKPASPATSFDEIRKNLSEFRRLSAAPPVGEVNSSAPNRISFQEIYNRNVKPVGGGGGGIGLRSGSSNSSFEAIRESLKQMRSGNSSNNNHSVGGMQRKTGGTFLFSDFKNDSKLNPMDGNAVRTPSAVIGGTQDLPKSVFGKELKDGERNADSPDDDMSTEFVKTYSYGELGEKLRSLRPEAKGKNKKPKPSSLLHELNERLRNLRELENKQAALMIGAVPYKDLRESLARLSMKESKKKAIQRLNPWSQIGTTSKLLLQPPKEHLLEKYFHPDNMSSKERAKIELAKVREEFKMSESDCGSARVQVAQLTTKIKHLSSVLHKKDKHCKRGLQAMVQRRKKLLKYLRRTDWESYCFVLDKLGLRDNPDLKV